MQLTPLTLEEAESVLSLYARPPGPDEGRVPSGNLLYRHKSGQDSNPKPYLLSMLQNPTAQPERFQQLYINNVTINLNVETRANMTVQKPMSDLRSPDPFNNYQVLFIKDNLRMRVREIIFRAFKKYFVLDPTNGNLRIALSNRPPADDNEEKGLKAESLAFYDSCDSIEKFSAGVKAYTGVIVELVAGNPRVVVIDEPEAFLYPPLAQQLGSELAVLATETGKNVFAATHSAQFLMGCLYSGAALDVIRLTYQDGVATARVLKNPELTKMMRNPLLRSAGVMNALFYECVVVTESDSDRAFYQEINERLLKASDGRGIPNCLFLNAQNKQTVRMIVQPLRAIGIPTASIVDIDILKEGKSVWSDYLESGTLPEVDKKAMATSRALLNAAFEAKAPKNMKKDGGIGLLKKTDMEAANNLFERLEEYGLFVVRGGEVESWLKSLGVVGHTPDWLSKIFEKLGEDPADSQYIKPGHDDVWAFMDNVGRWLLNPERKGIPD